MYTNSESSEQESRPQHSVGRALTSDWSEKSLKWLPVRNFCGRALDRQF